MESFESKQILQKVEELVTLIQQEEAYQKYLKLSLLMKKDTDISSCIRRIKENQKKIVQWEYQGKDSSLYQKKIEEDLRQLQTYPIYLEYSYLQEDLNSLFQTIKNTIEHQINEKIK